jgi:hypothetical protein
MRVVNASDGSPGAELAIGLADAIHWPADSQLRVVAVAEPIVMLGGPMIPEAIVMPTTIADMSWIREENTVGTSTSRGRRVTTSGWHR